MSASIATVARDQLRSLAGLLKDGWSAKQAQVLVRQFAALAELASEHHSVELSSLARALSASVLLYVKAGPDEAGVKRLMDLGRKVNALLVQGLPDKKSDGPMPLAEVRDDFRRVFMLVDAEPKANAVNLRELQVALAQRQLSLEVFAEGDSLMEALGKTTPAVLICEAALMPAMSELLDVIEKEQPGLSTRVPLLAVNQHVSPARRLAAALGWADSYLEAPNLAQVTDTVVELAAPRSEASYQVLIVDDDRQQAMFCAGVLKRKGMEVTSALSAEEALIALTTMRPDLVLMDLYLPGLNGMELTAILRQRSDSLLLPIVFLSGEQDAQKRFDALNIGGDDYLTKPIRPRHLATAVASRIKRVRALRAQLSEARQPIDAQGLYRRAAFFELLQQQAERPASESQVLMYISLDHAASLSAQLSVFGQNLLEQTLCTRFSEVIESADALTSLGGFDYALLVNRADSERLNRLAESLRQSISMRAVAIQDDELALCISIGLIEQVQAKRSAERWLTLAQMGAQRSQQRGGNRVERGLYEVPKAAPARQKVIQELLEQPPNRNNTQWEYQPIVPLRGRVLAQYVQHLRLRGNTVSTSMLPRSEYIESAERLNVIERLDRFACQNAIQTIGESARYGTPTRLHVRIHAQTLGSEFINVLRHELTLSTLDPSLLMIELDFHELELEFSGTPKKLDALKALGIGVAIQISMLRPKMQSMLQKLKPDCVKIQASLLTDAYSTELLSALAPMRESIVLVAVDIPNQEALSGLWQHHIDYVQANLLGAPRAQLDFQFATLKPAA
jgi:PleD family two-component response regulator/EAL domain-containing protein (putative c-di-GMP-specific phosphodiesterase class I)